MKELKADHWSRIGRIRRTQLRVGKQAFGNAKFLAGRLVADLSGDGAKVSKSPCFKALNYILTG
jgi:DNA polymerase alpha subunit A